MNFDESLNEFRYNQQIIIKNVKNVKDDIGSRK